MPKSRDHSKPKTTTVYSNAKKGIFNLSGESLAIYTLTFFSLIFVILAFVGFKFSNDRTHLTDEERNDLLARKERKRENIIKSKMKKLEMRLRASKVRKKVAETSIETERLIEDKKAQWEEKVSD